MSVPSPSETTATTTPSRISVTEYRAAHFCKHGPTLMAKHYSSQTGEQTSRGAHRADDQLGGQKESEVDDDSSKDGGDLTKGTRSPESSARSCSPPRHSFLSPRSRTQALAPVSDPVDSAAARMGALRSAPRGMTMTMTITLIPTSLRIHWTRPRAGN
ncbi:uncharacterized protein IUM83_03241 [Phytophthora cinnamomi]|uniref:uncharacterized protein n=1 Tax=Phytophthora cinnamomi TaxID=4785 RepID=UPI00355A7B1C|nr:hypothetical protein IUM83_03241 [Phytophthora cinnamomi]